jgi:hypothetical protein
MKELMNARKGLSLRPNLIYRPLSDFESIPHVTSTRKLQAISAPMKIATIASLCKLLAQSSPGDGSSRPNELVAGPALRFPIYQEDIIKDREKYEIQDGKHNVKEKFRN